MSMRTDTDLIRDILDAVAEIDAFTAGMDKATFTADMKTIRAVE